MKIHNEIATILHPLEFKVKKNGKPYAEILVEFAKGFRTSRGKQYRKTQYTIRCFGSREWLSEIKEKAVVDEQILVSGELDQQRVNIDGKSLAITVIIAQSQESLNFFARSKAS